MRYTPYSHQLVHSVLIALLVATSVQAQTSGNLTLTFSPSSSSTCGPAGSADSITFSTAFIPPDGTSACITLSDVFTGNSTTRDTGYSFGNDRVNITFTIDNQDAYDPRANYTNLLYTQLGLDGHDPTDGSYAGPRDVQFYVGDQCSDGYDGAVQPWFKSNCRAQDSCESLPIAVRSFVIRLPRKGDYDFDDRGKQGSCVLAKSSNGVDRMSASMLLLSSVMALLYMTL